MNEKDHEWESTHVLRGFGIYRDLVPGRVCKRCGKTTDRDSRYDPEDPMD